jgi:hypothetical protein
MNKFNITCDGDSDAGEMHKTMTAKAEELSQVAKKIQDKLRNKEVKTQEDFEDAQRHFKFPTCSVYSWTVLGGACVWILFDPPPPLSRSHIFREWTSVWEGRVSKGMVGPKSESHMLIVGLMGSVWR